MNHTDPMHPQDAMQSRERGKLLLRKLSQNRERGKERDQERERLHQLQSINNLLLDLPPPSTHLTNYSQDTSSSQSDKNISTDGEIAAYFTPFPFARARADMRLNENIYLRRIENCDNTLLPKLANLSPAIDTRNRMKGFLDPFRFLLHFSFAQRRNFQMIPDLC